MPIKSGYSYRIKKQTMKDGSVVFRPQGQVGNEWFELPASLEEHGYLTLEDARNEIILAEKLLAARTITHEEYIEFKE